MIILEKPTTRRQQEFLAAVKRSKRFHGSWVIAPHTSAAFKACLQGTRGEAHLSYWVVTENHALAGVINVNEIVRGAFCSGYLGLLCVHSTQWQRVYEPRLGNGPEECLSGSWAGPVEANIQPGNDDSRRLIERLGFRLEGFSPRYLKIAGRWRDHERWALTIEDWKANGGKAG